MCDNYSLAKVSYIEVSIQKCKICFINSFKLYRSFKKQSSEKDQIIKVFELTSLKSFRAVFYVCRKNILTNVKFILGP